MGSLTLNDDRFATDELLTANFLVPPSEDNYHKKCLAELCCDSLKDFNPMVRVSVKKGEALLVELYLVHLFISCYKSFTFAIRALLVSLES